MSKTQYNTKHVVSAEHTSLQQVIYTPSANTLNSVALPSISSSPLYITCGYAVVLSWVQNIDDSLMQCGRSSPACVTSISEFKKDK